MVQTPKIMRILRESNDYSQEYVADYLNINQKTYSNLEAGKSKLTVERIQKLAELYHVKPEYFLSEELPIINYNSGDHSRSIIAGKSYQEGYSTDIHDKIIKEKDVQIIRLIEEITYIKKEKEELYSVIKGLSAKINQS